eukprot:scaffold133949_cov31-Tisochrysis_lutea.AAC.1
MGREVQPLLGDRAETGHRRARRTCAIWQSWYEWDPYSHCPPAWVSLTARQTAAFPRRTRSRSS